MPLKAKIASLTEVEAKHRDLYRATGDGSFVLDVEPVGGLSLGNVDGLKATADKWRSQVERFLVAEKAAAALDGAQIDPAWRDYFLAQVTAAAQLHEEGDKVEVEIVDDKGLRRIGSRGDWLTLEGFVAELKQKRPRCFRDDNKKPGATGFDGPNPWLAAHRNLTMQGRIIRDNPDLARRLMVEADVNPGTLGSSRSSGSFSRLNPFKRESWNLTEQGRLFRDDRATYECLKAAV
ncbi:hypothetical protein AA309_12035 [Microvirga vignae]|uniref:Uncharacterized protein n=1 Tax=Microvirga vignae TaxID=1225564 RepID=A0A0H1RCE4_9HYPH|nr:hypothetical protein [Microvirga vignae]KLK92848.1 hypothetical protein AA309_12035 [Microvirga vignae]